MSHLSICPPPELPFGPCTVRHPLPYHFLISLSHTTIIRAYIQQHGGKPLSVYFIVDAIVLCALQGFRIPEVSTVPTMLG